jgi:hypothetical protein
MFRNDPRGPLVDLSHVDGKAKGWGSESMQGRSALGWPRSPVLRWLIGKTVFARRAFVWIMIQLALTATLFVFALRGDWSKWQAPSTWFRALTIPTICYL